jgi:EAL domain-containing protein (putative c-di-GMP-specific phosphodiesterase class I)
MELETVAEYVETKKAKALVTKLGVDYAQGHVVGKPTSFDGILANISDKSRSSSA